MGGVYAFEARVRVREAQRFFDTWRKLTHMRSPMSPTSEAAYPEKVPAARKDDALACEVVLRASISRLTTTCDKRSNPGIESALANWKLPCVKCDAKERTTMILALQHCLVAYINYKDPEQRERFVQLRQGVYKDIEETFESEGAFAWGVERMFWHEDEWLNELQTRRFDLKTHEVICLPASNDEIEAARLTVKDDTDCEREEDKEAAEERGDVVEEEEEEDEAAGERGDVVEEEEEEDKEAAEECGGVVEEEEEEEDEAVEEDKEAAEEEEDEAVAEERGGVVEEEEEEEDEAVVEECERVVEEEEEEDEAVEERGDVVEEEEEDEAVAVEERGDVVEEEEEDEAVAVEERGGVVGEEEERGDEAVAEERGGVVEEEEEDEAVAVEERGDMVEEEEEEEDEAVAVEERGDVVEEAAEGEKKKKGKKRKAVVRCEQDKKKARLEDDASGKKKSLIDFMHENKLFHAFDKKTKKPVRENSDMKKYINDVKKFNLSTLLEMWFGDSSREEKEKKLLDMGKVRMNRIMGFKTKIGYMKLQRGQFECFL